MNLGNPTETTLLELTHEVIRATNSASEIVFEALPLDDPKVRRPDIARARQLLGWEPQIVLADGLSRVVAFASSNHAHSLTALH